jgi:hypothetical protein
MGQRLGCSTPNQSYRSIDREDPDDKALRDKASQSQRPNGVSEEFWNSQVAAGKAMTILEQKAKGFCTVEAGSVYGCALAFPQLARTAGWSLKYTALAILCGICLAFNVVLQGFLLYMLSKEERIMSKFGGQMHLCDFGSHLEGCPDGPNCIGPGGTEYTPSRLYDWNMWTTRVYVRDSLKALFPEKSDLIDEKVDPGEYGLESYYLRAACVLLFVMGLWHDLKGSWTMLNLLYYVPSKEEAWMVYEVPSWDEDKEHAKAVHGWSELELVKFRINGMPLHWKFVNLMFILLPKVYLWILTVDIGTVFLLETSVIEDMIINAVALDFILSIDELIVQSVMPFTVTHMLDNLESFALFDTADEEDDTEKDCFEKHQLDKRWGIFSPELYITVFPVKLCGILGTTVFFIAKYYIEHCKHEGDGSWVSQAVVLPADSILPFPSFIFGPFPLLFPVETASGGQEVVWKMPIDS